jgi:hypothetical protein
MGLGVEIFSTHHHCEYRNAVQSVTAVWISMLIKCYWPVAMVCTRSLATNTTSLIFTEDDSLGNLYHWTTFMYQMTHAYLFINWWLIKSNIHFTGMYLYHCPTVSHIDSDCNSLTVSHISLWANIAVVPHCDNHWNYHISLRLNLTNIPH